MAERTHFTALGKQLLGDKDLFSLSGETIKVNRQRTVTRVEVAGVTMYVKRTQARGLRAWLRDVFRGSKAKLEFTNALRLQALGIACIEPLAYAERGRESLFISRAADGVTLEEYLQQPLMPKQTRAVATAFGRYVRTMFEAGIIHPDAHPGNFLIAEVRGELRFTLIDLHALKFAKAKDRNGTRMLVQLNRYFQLRASHTDRARFLAAYFDNGFTQNLRHSVTSYIEHATTHSNLRFWQARLKRWSGTNRETAVIRVGPYHGYVDRSLPTDFRDSFLAEPDAMLKAANAKLLKDSRTSTVALVEHGGHKYIVKRFNLRSRFQVVKNLFRTSPARRSWLHGRSFADRGLPTAKPLLFVERRTFGLSGTSYVIFEYLADNVELHEATSVNHDREMLAKHLGRLLRTMHERGVSHRDLKPSNIFVSSSGKLAIIDLVGTSLQLDVPESTRIKNLARLNAGFPPGTSSLTVRLRLLHAYLGRDVGQWKRWWQAIHEQSEAKWQSISNRTSRKR